MQAGAALAPDVSVAAQIGGSRAGRAGVTESHRHLVCESTTASWDLVGRNSGDEKEALNCLAGNCREHRPWPGCLDPQPIVASSGLSSRKRGRKASIPYEIRPSMATGNNATLPGSNPTSIQVLPILLVSRLFTHQQHHVRVRVDSGHDLRNTPLISINKSSVEAGTNPQDNKIMIPV